MSQKIREILSETPVICAVKNEEELSLALKSESKLVFILFGDILKMKYLGEKVLSIGKIPFLHLDMIQGLNSNPIILELVKEYFGSKCGVISTRSNLVQRAKELNIPCVYRMFIMDSIAVKNEINLLNKMKNKPDAIEIMPGVIPKVICKFKEETKNIPIVVGGLIESKNEIIEALKHGAVSISTSKKELWD